MTGVGLDVGSAWTKIATGAVEVDVTPTDLPREAFVGAGAPLSLTAFLTRLPRAFDGPAALVIAVPDPWLGGSAPLADELSRCITESIGVPAPRMVSELLCAAAARPGPPSDGVQVLCDVGAQSVAAAACARDGAAVRLLAVEHAPDGAAVVDAALLDVLVGTGAAAAQRRVRLRRALDRARRGHGLRAELLFEHLNRVDARPRGRAAAEAWRTVPVYPMDGDHRLTLGVVERAARPLAAAVRGVLERLAVRLRGRAPTAVAVTGGARGCPGVGQAVSAVWPDLGVVLCGSGSAARGAYAIAAGRVEAVDQTTPGVRIRARQRSQGVQQNTTIEVAAPRGVLVRAAAATALAMELRDPVDGEWRKAAPGPPVPAGRLDLGVRDLRGGHVDLVVRQVAGGPPLVVPVREER